MQKSHEDIRLSPLGKTTTYTEMYQRDLLFSISRKSKRDEIDVPVLLPFKGVDIWNAYEISWLNLKGKPLVALGQFIVPSDSPHIFESKSLKLYLSSFTNTQFDSVNTVSQIIQQDLSDFTKGEVKVKITPITQFSEMQLKTFTGICLDELDVDCNQYSVKADFLQTEDEIISETLYSNLLKSNCLVTGQPDWGSVQIQYTGQKIQHEGLLRYLVSFRNHNEFHEQCVERIFMDIMRRCQPQRLTVYACYTRRGGLDINPFRSTEQSFPDETARQVRQ
ncbi:MAG TPA: NADPH-dependent 7-cyano-7-deazaguanine reductase QueF [Gammaproteobacteria bacterium]|nr:NADPH-dependent 7-cyano-7-deazaguanine reductase QueF [Gammaproteobacteria bacterium]